MANRNGQEQLSKSGDIEDLGARLDAVRSKHQDNPEQTDDGSLLGMAWRLSTELVVSILVGLGLGYGVDVLLGTKPWGLLIGLGFGFAAGIMAVLRTSAKMDAQNADVPLGNDLPDDEDE